eukprot:TRINITY_DN77709_c0_g1_i2.p1 TRINITY_DN77709_c0_g1~~TRINITY_DN77709_c0_g1_i2.p1  ORF type:complete len:141 (+),score=8.97 TRINITY_DN77709_c0_g1_i2:414-836(+)
MLELTDTAGSEGYSFLSDHYYNSGDAYVCVYSITDKQSFNKIEDIITSINRAREASSGEVPIIIVGNKCDLDEERMVDYNTAKSFADSYLTDFIECSAKTNENIFSIFEIIVRRVWKTTKPPFESNDKGKSLSKRKCTLL